MKFWKILSYLILQTLPDWRDKFLSYKDLKKQLKLIYPINGDHDASRPIKRPKLTAEERESDAIMMEVNNFVCLLEAEIEKFNNFVVEKEEEYIIRWKVNLQFLLFFLLFIYQCVIMNLTNDYLKKHYLHVFVSISDLFIDFDYDDYIIFVLILFLLLLVEALAACICSIAELFIDFDYNDFII